MINFYSVPNEVSETQKLEYFYPSFPEGDLSLDDSVSAVCSSDLTSFKLSSNMKINILLDTTRYSLIDGARGRVVG